MIDMHKLTDRELQELVLDAKRVPDNLREWHQDENYFFIKQPQKVAADGFINVPFRPLQNLAHALRLAIDLELSIIFHDCLDDSPIVKVGDYYEHEKLQQYPNYPDSSLATCRAIVIAAARRGQELHEFKYLLKPDNK